MLGDGIIAPQYPVELAQSLLEIGYQTAIFGKNHFGWNSTSGTGIRHAYQNLTLYDGVTGENDDTFHRWFQEQHPGGVTPGAAWT